MDTALSAAVRRFPLLGRPRPACPALPEWLREIADIAAAARRQGVNGIADAAHALNKAALLASDCGLTDLANDLCWQHIDIYRAADRKLTSLEARYMLEPVLNLARLQIRADAGEQALQLLTATYRAVTTSTDLVVNGHTLPLANPTGTQQEQGKLREWVWLQYLADGIRALALAGRWDEAVEHAKAHSGIGLHLMEGRQAAIIASCLQGALSTARAMVKESTLTQPWEQQVAHCLNVMCADPDKKSVGRDVAAMVAHFRRHEPMPGYAVFRARLGLTVVTLASATDPGTAARVLTQVAGEAIDAGDGYAARDVLGFHGAIADVTEPQRRALSGLVTDSGLGSRTLLEPLLKSFVASVEMAKEALAASTTRHSTGTLLRWS